MLHCLHFLSKSKAFWHQLLAPALCQPVVAALPVTRHLTGCAGLLWSPGHMLLMLKVANCRVEFFSFFYSQSRCSLLPCVCVCSSECVCDDWFNMCAWLSNAPRVCSLTRTHIIITRTGAWWGCLNHLTTHDCNQAFGKLTFLNLGGIRDLLQFGGISRLALEWYRVNTHRLITLIIYLVLAMYKFISHIYIYACVWQS